METKNIYNLIILDESGSMSNIERQAVSAVNETIQSVRKAQEENPGQNYHLSLYVFSGHGMEGVRMVRDRVPVENIDDFLMGEYGPNGCTPLYDAMGTGISHLKASTRKGDPVLVTIITDGMENSSREYSQTAIQHIVSERRKEGWTFAYIGANQDAVEVARDLNIKNALNFEATEEGTLEMGATLADSTLHFCCMAPSCAADDADGFFDVKKKKKR